MEYAFKIGQQVYRHVGGGRGGPRTGPCVIVGIVRQSCGTVLYRIKGPTREQLADGAELRLALTRAKKIDMNRPCCGRPPADKPCLKAEQSPKSAT
jgi:hypothetical protein